MKLSRIKYMAMAVVAAALCLQSCSDDEHYDVVGNPNNLVYFKTVGDPVATCGVTHTPVGDFGEVKASFDVAIQHANSSDTRVTAVVDNSLVDEYNTEHGTQYTAVPDGLVETGNLTTTIRRDTVGCSAPIEVSVPESAFAQLTAKAYLIPIRLSEVDGNGKASGQRGTAYVIINVESKLIKAGVAADDMPGTLMTDYTGVTAWYTASGTVDDMAQLFDGDLTNGTALRTDEQDGKGTTLVFDLGQQQSVQGLRVARYQKVWWGGWWTEEYFFSQLDIEFSTDGATWNEAGSVGESDMAKSDGYQYVAFYGAVPMRYLRINFASGSSQVSSLAELGIYTK